MGKLYTMCWLNIVEWEDSQWLQPRGGCDCASYSCRKPWLQMKHSHPKHFPTFTDYPTVSPNSPKRDGSSSPTSCITPPGTSSDILGPDPAFQSRTLNCTFLVSFKRLLLSSQASLAFWYLVSRWRVGCADGWWADWDIRWLWMGAKSWSSWFLWILWVQDSTGRMICNKPNAMLLYDPSLFDSMVLSLLGSHYLTGFINRINRLDMVR